jgi:hypothetical protein
MQTAGWLAKVNPICLQHSYEDFDQAHSHCAKPPRSGGPTAYCTTSLTTVAAATAASLCAIGGLVSLGRSAQLRSALMASSMSPVGGGGAAAAVAWAWAWASAAGSGFAATTPTACASFRLSSAGWPEDQAACVGHFKGCFCRAPRILPLRVAGHLDWLCSIAGQRLYPQCSSICYHSQKQMRTLNARSHAFGPSAGLPMQPHCLHLASFPPFQYSAIQRI